MIRLNLLILISLLLIGAPASVLKAYTDCPSIEASFVLENPDANQKNGKITVMAKGGRGKLHYFFFNEKGRPINSTKEELNFVKDLGQGTYKCSVVDENGCIKQLLIELNSK